jgi:cyanophycin synthetase
VPQPVGQAIVDHLFAPDESGRVPIVGVTGRQHTTAIARLVAWLLHLHGRQVGLACSAGLFLGPRRVETRVKKPYDAALRLLMNRRVDAVVAENDAGAVLSDGLAYDRCTVGIVTDLTLDDSLHHHDVRETAQLFKVLRTQVDVVLADGAAVLNAEDAQVADMAELCDGEVIFYSRSSEAAALVAHRHGGGRAVVRARARPCCCPTRASSWAPTSIPCCSASPTPASPARRRPCWPRWPPPGRWASRPS